MCLSHILLLWFCNRFSIYYEKDFKLFLMAQTLPNIISGTTDTAYTNINHYHYDHYISGTS